MKLRTHSLALALGAALALTPAIADAKRIYFLVGVRHVYRIGPDRDLYVDQREDIEKTYADGVASDEATYQQHVTAGADAAAEGQARDQDLELLAEDRDKSLGALFDVRDDLRAKHPEFDLKGDGPYQVIGVDFHMQSEVVVYDDYCVYAPWPGYVWAGRPYGGWAYGTVYTPGLFVSAYSGWSVSFGVGIGVPLFWGGFYGHAGIVPWRGGVFVGPAAVWAHPGGGGYYHAFGVHQGFIGTRGFTGHAGPGGVGHVNFNPGGPNRGVGAPGHAGPGYGHGAPGGGLSHSAGGYTHSGGATGGRGWGGSSTGHGGSGNTDRGASGNHSSGSSNADRGASGNRSASSHGGGYSHSGGSHSSNHSSSSHDSHGGSSNKDSHDHH